MKAILFSSFLCVLFSSSPLLADAQKNAPKPIGMKSSMISSPVLSPAEAGAFHHPKNNRPVNRPR